MDPNYCAKFDKMTSSQSFFALKKWAKFGPNVFYPRIHKYQNLEYFCEDLHFVSQKLKTEELKIFS